jgi:hypothetical protein
MPSTYFPIATTTLANSTTATVSFTSIAGTYTDLVLVASSAITSGGGALKLNYNSDTGSNYSRTILTGNGSAASSTRETSQASLLVNTNGNLDTVLGQNTTIINIVNYSNSSAFKTTLSRSGRAANGTDAIVGLWRNTGAITRIDIANTGSSTFFLSGSTFTLYGIKAA